MKKLRLIVLILGLLILPFSARADSVQIQLDNGEILELESTIPALFELNKYPNGITISMKGGTFLTVRSLGSKELFVAPIEYSTSKVCSTGSSSIIAFVPSSETVADVSVVVGGNVCGASPTPTTTTTPSSTPSSTPTPSGSVLPSFTTLGAPLTTGGSGIMPTSTGVPTNVPTASSGGSQSESSSSENIGALSNLSTVVATVGTIATLSALLASYLAQLGPALQSFEAFKFWLLNILGFRKKRKPWGVVINKYMAKPIPGVLVRAFDTEYKKLRDTQLTDETGRFLFLLGEGEYFIKFSKNGFEDLESQVIKVADPNEPVFLNIEVVPERFFGAEQMLVGTTRRFFVALREFLVKVNPVVLLGGTVLSSYIITISPSGYNYVVLAVYLIFDAIQLYYIMTTAKSYGKVVESATSSPIGLAIVRLFDLNKQLLLSTKTTDDMGRFSFLVKKGDYYMTCCKAGFDTYTSEKIEFRTEEVVSQEIRLRSNNPNN